MIQRLTRVAEAVDRLTLRERLFLFAAGLFVVGGVWQAVLAGPLEARERTANEKVVVLQSRLIELDEALSAAAAGVTEGMPEQLERARALRESVLARDEEMRVLTTDLIDPKEMRAVLEELLRRQRGLTLVSAINRPAQLVIEDDRAASATAEPAAVTAESDAPKLYRHSFVLTLRGDYLDVLRYLEDVERLPWHIYWSRLELSIDEYPVNDVVVEVATLSLDEEWIGV
jgi:MSHA biogenesis protein MshJ